MCELINNLSAELTDLFQLRIGLNKTLVNKNIEAFRKFGANKHFELKKLDDDLEDLRTSCGGDDEVDAIIKKKLKHY